jgi:hypothetical protein
MQTSSNPSQVSLDRAIVRDSTLPPLGAPLRPWLRCMSPASWYGALLLFFLPWMEISCINAKGEVTNRITMSGAELVWGGATDRSERPERLDAKPGVPAVKVEIAPDTFKQKPDPKRIAGRWLLAAYGLLLMACFSFALVRPGFRRAWAGLLSSLILLALLLSGSWLLLEKPVSPPEPSRMFGEWVVVSYTPWYYASYLVNVAALLWFGIELWIICAGGAGGYTFRRSFLSQEVDSKFMPPHAKCHHQRLSKGELAAQTHPLETKKGTPRA